MNKFLKVGKKIAAAGAPLLGGLLGGPAGAAVGTIVAEALGVENDPDAIERAISVDPDAAVKLAEIEATHKVELRRIALQAESEALEARMAMHAETQATHREEIKSEDKFVRRARPMLLYTACVIATLIVCGILAVTFVVIFEPPEAGNPADVIQAIGEAIAGMQVILWILFGAAGLYVPNRTKDKQVAAGMQPVGLLSGLFKR